MKFTFKLNPFRRLRSSMRNSWFLVIVLFLASGWFREIVFADYIWNATKFLNDQLAHSLGRGNSIVWIRLLLGFATAASMTFSITWIVSRIVIDFPGYTKALFWGIMRSYEHNLSKTEARILIGLPAFMSVAIFATGFVSLAACLLSAISLAFHSSSYNMKRLKHRTDDFMKMRSQVGLANPTEFSEAKSTERY